MWVYFCLFLVPALLAVEFRYQRSRQGRYLWLATLAILVVAIGFRHEVGGDWYNYLDHFRAMRYFRLREVLELGDPAYYVLNWLVYQSGLSVHWVNLACALIVVAGVGIFSAAQPLPWLSLAVSVPYLLVVVAMGYTRQSVALGLVLVALAALGQGRTRLFFGMVLGAALFHKSALLMMPIAALSVSRNRWWTAIWVGVLGLLGFYLLLLDSAPELWDAYVERGKYSSEGGVIRVAMNAVPAVLLLVYRKSIFSSVEERNLWLWMALLSLLTVPLVYASSTAVDRVALYFIPLQMFLFARLPLLGRDARNFNLLYLGTLFYYGAVMCVWLSFAHHAEHWLPYRNYLFY